MSNLVDKALLLKAFERSTGINPISLLREEILSGNLDFHPVPRNAIETPHKTIDVAQIRPICLGAASGKACPKLSVCKFAAGTANLPCNTILVTLGARGKSITDGEIVIWSSVLHSGE